MFLIFKYLTFIPSAAIFHTKQHFSGEKNLSGYMAHLGCKCLDDHQMATKEFGWPM